MITRRILLGGVAAAAAAGRARAAGTPITLGLSSNSMGFGGLRIAEQAGLFEKNGLSPTIKVLESGSAATAALIAGSLEFASASVGEVLAARMHGQRLLVVANAYRGLAGSLVLFKPLADKLGIAVSGSLDARLKAVGGLPIATPSATSSYTFPFRIACQSAGVQPRFVYMGQPAMISALKTGAIQGMIAGAPFSTEAVSSGAGTMWVSGPKGALPFDVMPTSSSTIETTEGYAAANPSVIARLRAVFAAVGTLITESPRDAERLLAQAYPQLSPDTIATIFQDDGPNWTRPVLTVDDMRHEIGLQQRAGVLKGVEAVDPTSILAP